jgi:hypothetical protein
MKFAVNCPVENGTDNFYFVSVEVFLFETGKVEEEKEEA